MGIKVSETYNSNSQWLKAADLKGKDVTVKIEGVGIATVENDGKTQEKLEVSFAGTDKALLCNVTNARTLADAFGDDTDDWTGKEIVLYAATVQGPQGMTQGLRLRPVRNDQPEMMGDDSDPF